MPPVYCILSVFTSRAVRDTCPGACQGLGKTAQSIATLAFLRQFLGIRGPHIVIAPLTTLGHWQCEIETWTGMVGAPAPPPDQALKYTGDAEVWMWVLSSMRKCAQLGVLLLSETPAVPDGVQLA